MVQLDPYPSRGAFFKKKRKRRKVRIRVQRLQIQLNKPCNYCTRNTTRALRCIHEHQTGRLHDWKVNQILWSIRRQAKPQVLEILHRDLLAHLAEARAANVVLIHGHLSRERDLFTEDSTE